MLSMLIGADGKLLEGRHHVPIGSLNHKITVDSVLAAIEPRRAVIPVREVVITEGSPYDDRQGDLSYRHSATWRTLYHERDGAVLFDVRR